VITTRIFIYPILKYTYLFKIFTSYLFICYFSSHRFSSTSSIFFTGFKQKES